MFQKFTLCVFPDKIQDTPMWFASFKRQVSKVRRQSSPESINEIRDQYEVIQTQVGDRGRAFGRILFNHVITVRFLGRVTV